MASSMAAPAATMVLTALIMAALLPGALRAQARKAMAPEQPARVADLCNNVPGQCTPAGWVPKNPFPEHPINAPCCVAIRSAGLNCLCLLQNKWHVPRTIVDNYVKDCKLPPSLTCPRAEQA